MKKKVAWITPNTHWDREWVMTLGQYQVRLHDLVNNLLDIIDRAPDDYVFFFDGQTVWIDDYMEVASQENTDRLLACLESGRIVAGPWFVLADQFMENAESTIRNLFFGRQSMQSYNSEALPIGYVPDSFGSVSGLPTLLAGFGIRHITFGRSMPWDEFEKAKQEFLWKGPDGSMALAANYGYGNGLFMSYPDIWCDIHRRLANPEEALETFKEKAESFAEKATTRHIYFSVGVDHMEARGSLPEIVEYIRNNQDEYELYFGTPLDFLKAVEEESPELENYRGEMRGSAEFPHQLAGTLSSHIELKQANFRAERLLQNWVEPFAVMNAVLCGNPYHKDLIDRLWRQLLLNHPHDSICGCSLDIVHRDMMQRYEDIEHTGNYLVKDSLHALMQCINTQGPSENAIPLTVWNPLGRKHSGPVRQWIRIPKRLRIENMVIVDEHNVEQLGQIREIARKNKDLESLYMTNGQLGSVISKVDDETRPDDQIFTVAEVDFAATDVPAMGWRTYWIISPENTTESERRVKKTEQGMENDFLRVKIETNGTLTLEEKASGVLFENLGIFEDREDKGNLYYFDGFDDPHVISTAASIPEIRLVEDLPQRVRWQIKHNLELPVGVEGEKRSVKTEICPLTVSVALHCDCRYVDIEIDFDNRVKDHCLHFVMPTTLQTDHCSAAGHYDVVDRKINPEDRVGQDAPFQDFVDISDNARGLALISRGLPAYGVVQPDAGTTILKSTLLRAVGTVGWAAGANHPVEEGQCLGRHRFELALMPHSDRWSEAAVPAVSRQYRTPFLAESGGTRQSDIPSCGSFLCFDVEDGQNNILIEALKQSEDRSKWILRLWNSDKKDIPLIWEGVVNPIKFAPLRLDETPLEYNGEPVLKSTSPSTWGFSTEMRANKT